MSRMISVLLMIFILLTVCLPALAQGEDTKSVAETLDFSEIEKYVNKVDEEVKEHLPDLSIEKLYQDAKEGRISWNPKDVFLGLVRFFFREILANSALLTRLIILAVAGAVLTNLQGTFDKGNISLLAHGVVYLVLITIALSSFSVAINTGKEAIENMSGFLYAVMPVLLTLLAAMGGVTSAALIQPVMVVILTLAITIIKTVIFPMIYFMVILNVVSHISPEFKVNRLAGLFKDLAIGLLGIVMTIFVGFLSLQGITGAVADGLTFKAAKFAAGVFIPVVGKSLADAMDTVIGTSLILKNGIGILGVIVIFIMCALPAVKIIAMSLMYRIVAAIIQPFGNSQLADALHGLANSLILVFAVVAAAGLMFFFVLSITVCSANISMMFR
ncbi:MAG: stage III sporulation protein AE [Bacillota bacterium]|jgi:stage III sporulation protein AE